MGRSNSPPCWRRHEAALPWRNAASPIFRFVEAAELRTAVQSGLVHAMPTQQFLPLKLDRVILVGAAALILLNLCGSASSAPKNSRLLSKLKNIELCNGSDRSSPEPQIRGCTALIDDARETKLLRSVAYNNRGDAYVAKGDLDAAIKDYNDAIDLNPDFARPFNNRGVAYHKKGDYDRALKDFDQAIKLNPDYARAFANRAETHQMRRDYQAAARDYDSAVRLQPDLMAGWNGRCWTRAILGELQPALADCNKALAIKPNDAATLDSRALIYLKMGQLDSAINDYSSALRITPTLASALYGRGLARIKKGDSAG